MDELTGEVIKLVVTLSAPVLAALATAFLVRMFKKAGIEIELKKQEKVKGVIEDAIARTEEWAASRAKAKLPVPKGTKLQKTLGDVLDKLPGVSTAEANELVHAGLRKAGAGATVAVKAIREAAENK